jgi:hypothetical protein
MSSIGGNPLNVESIVGGATGYITSTFGNKRHSRGNSGVMIQNNFNEIMARQKIHQQDSANDSLNQSPFQQDSAHPVETQVINHSKHQRASNVLNFHPRPQQLLRASPKEQEPLTQ